MKKLLSIIAIFTLTLFSFFAVATPAFAGNLDLCPETTNAGEEGETNFTALCTLDPGGVIGTVITFAFILAIIIALFYLVWGGIKWITSGGDKGNVETARNHIIAAVIGLIVVFLAYFIINLVLKVFLGIDSVGSIGLPSLPSAQDSDNNLDASRQAQICTDGGGTPIFNTNGRYLRCE